MKDHIQHRPPASSDELKLKSPARKGVGLPAIGSSLYQIGKWMDVPEALKASFKMNQKKGFDCPGCAWPDPDDDRSRLGEYCENGIKALAEERTKYRADPAFWAKHSVAELSNWSEFKLGKSGRITEPMYLPEGASHYEPISWDAAFQKIADCLHGLEDPNEAIFYTSGRTSNEAAFLYGLFARMYGTNNLPDCSNMCHESSGRGLSETLGVGKGSVSLQDLHEAELIMIIGQNPGTNHPRMLNALETCKSNGGKIIAVNPLKETGLIHYTNPQRPLRILSGGVHLADLYLQVRINGDLALLKAILLKLLELHEGRGDVLDETFIADYTQGFEALKEDLKRYDFSTLVEQAGLQEADVMTAVELIANRKRVIIAWAMGVTQQPNGVDNIKEIVNLLLLKGAIGKPGAGTCPVRGHSNVQGDRTMGIWEQMGDWYHDRIDEVFGFQSPRAHGYDTVGAINAMVNGKARFFMGMGGNFVSASPDTDLTAKGLRSCDLTVQVSTKPNRSHLVHGKEALILPCLGRTEIDMQASGYQFVSVENSMSVVHNSKGVLGPISEQLRSEPAIIAGLAMAVLPAEVQEKANWQGMMDDYDLIRDKIEAVIPGFENYNERVREGAGFYLPNAARERSFRPADNKAHFSLTEVPDNRLEPGFFHLMTMRSHDQYNTTIYGLHDRYRGISGDRRIILMSAIDMANLSLQAKDRIDVTSHFRGEEREVKGFRVVPYDIPQGCLGAYFPEANPLVHIDNLAEGSRTPASKLIVVSIRKSTFDQPEGN
ncbi:MAG: FdhF/YdeP family oxidoreductase [Bacteroidota bacterium]